MQKTKQLEITKEYYSELDDEHLFTVKSGDNTYRVCIRESGGNRCTCPYGYISKNSLGKHCRHEEAALEMIE